MKARLIDSISGFSEFLIEKTSFFLEVKNTTLDFISNPYSILGNLSSVTMGFVANNINFTLLVSGAIAALTVAKRIVELYFLYKTHKASEKRKEEEHKAKMLREQADFLQDNQMNQSDFEQLIAPVKKEEL